jgi:hypothetical protein
MTEFDNREKAFEGNFSSDAEVDFRISCRTAKLFGLWVAEQLGMRGAEAETYAQEAVGTVMEKSSHDHLIERAEKDLHFKGINLSRHRLEKEINGFNSLARTQMGL